MSISRKFKYCVAARLQRVCVWLRDKRVQRKFTRLSRKFAWVGRQNALHHRPLSDLFLPLLPDPVPQWLALAYVMLRDLANAMLAQAYAAGSLVDQVGVSSREQDEEEWNFSL